MAARPLIAWSDEAISTPPSAARTNLTEVAAKLSNLEWSIVAMAERDSLATLRAPNRFWSVLSAIFGLKPANRLANDRLEALRRIAVLAWRYRWNVPNSEVKAFFAAGYSPAHHELLQTRIGRVRSDRQGRKAR